METEVNDVAQEVDTSTDELSAQAHESIVDTEADGESSPSADTKIDAAQEKVNERINKITAEKNGEVRVAQREAHDLKLRLDAIEAQNQAASAKAPSLEDPDINFDEEKMRTAEIKHQIGEQFKIQRQNEAKAIQEQQRKNETETYQSRAVKYAETHKGYTDALNNLPQLHPDTVRTLQTMEKGPDIVHYMGEHLDVADQIASLPPYQAAVRLGEISAGLSSTTKVVKTSNAPNPVETISGSAAVNKSMDDMSMDEIMAM